MMIFVILIFLIGIIIYGEKIGVPSFLYHHIGEKGVSEIWFEEHLKIIKNLKMKTITNKDIEKEGVIGFVTTKKGTNALNIDLDSIKRIELRQFSPMKFKINLLIAKNYFLVKIYQILS